METEELTKELIEFLNENGLYQSFLSFEKDRGYDEDFIEDKIDEIENN